MAGDWIKMRGNLWDDPRVSRLCDLTDQSEAAIVGALYWLWATADQHTEDGVMPGLTLRQIDRKTGIQGFGQALCEIKWLADHPEGVAILNFEEHNGSSAKKRCQTAKRVANHKAGKTEVTQEALPETTGSVSSALPREEKRREESSKEETHTLSTAVEGVQPTDAGLICKAMKAVGIADVNPGHQTLRTLLEAGADVAEFVGAAQKAVAEQKGFAYAIGIVKNERLRASQLTDQIHRGALPVAETAYQRSMRERMQEAAPEAARKDPSHAAHAADFFNAIEVPTRTVERIR